jgi:hypothetical protein
MSEPIDKIDQGRHAAALRAAFAGRVQDLQHQILRELIAGHTENVLTEQRARAGIAEIAALDRLLTTLGREVRQGQQAEQRVIGMAAPGKPERAVVRS